MNKIQHTLLTLTFFSVPIIATLKGKGTPILALILFLTFGIKYIKEIPNIFKNITPKSISFWALLFVAWAVISCFWSYDITKTLSHACRYFGFILCGHLTFFAFQNFKTQDVEKYTKIYFWAFTLFFAYMSFEVLGPHWVSVLYTKSEIFNARLYINAVVIMLFLFWPFFLICSKKWGRKTNKAFLFLGFPFSIFLLLKTQPHAALFGLALSTLGFFLSLSPQKWIKVFKIGIISVCAFLPIITSQNTLLDKFAEEIKFLPTSYQHRLYIWNGMVNKNDTVKKKLVGKGFDFSTTVKGGEQKCFRHRKVKLNSDFSLRYEMDPPCEETIAIFTSHPHNGIIQIYTELGIIGLIIFLMLLWRIFGFIETQKDKVLRGIYFAVLLCYMTIFFISFGLWQTWMAGLMILTINSLLIITKYYQQKFNP